MNKIFHRIIGVALTLCLFFISGCGTKEEGKATTESGTTTELAVTDSVDAVTEVSSDGGEVEVKGTDERMKFTATLPTGWQFIDLSSDKPTAHFVKAETPEAIEIDSPYISVSIGSENLTPEEVLGMFVTESDDIEVSDTTIGGLAGWAFEKESMGSKFQYIVAAEKGRSIQIFISPLELSEDPDVKTILDSIRFDITE